MCRYSTWNTLSSFRPESIASTSFIICFHALLDSGDMAPLSGSNWGTSFELANWATPLRIPEAVEKFLAFKSSDRKNTSLTCSRASFVHGAGAASSGFTVLSFRLNVVAASRKLSASVFHSASFCMVGCETSLPSWWAA